MDDTIFKRIRRIYAAISVIEENDPNKLKATVVETNKIKAGASIMEAGLREAKMVLTEI